MSLSPPTRVLFVCMGNICRSPTAEGVFRQLARARGVADRFEVDSCGTGAWHAGEPADARARATAARHGVDLDGRARGIERDDLERFDHIVCMDEDNRQNLIELGAPDAKVRLLLESIPDLPVTEVPDPYYGGEEGFETVFQLVLRACEALLDELVSD